MRALRSRTRDRSGRLLLALGCLLLAGTAIVQAGGNTQVRDPADLANVIDRTWDSRMIPITWVLSDDGLPGSGIDNATLTTELTAAFDTWEALPTSALDFTFGGEVPVRSSGLGGPLGASIDGLNLITFTDPGLVFPPGVLAVALTSSFTNDTVVTSANDDLDGDGNPDIPQGTYPAGTIFDGDISFNSSEDWSTSGSNNTRDIRAVALHEVGHFFGLAHSMVRDAVMWPFLNLDIAAARTAKNDDIAYASFYYQQEPDYSSTFGSITGQVINGFSNAPILGAHVFAVDPLTGGMVVGAYSGDDGSYIVPGLVAGDYLVAIEPLDGQPVGLDPSRINQVVQFTFDTNFPEEFYDANESNVEADPAAGAAVTVAAGAATPAIDLITNTVQVPGVNVVLEEGYNLFAYPVEELVGLGSLDLLQAIGDETEVNSVQRYDSASGTFQRSYWADGVPAGVDFPIVRGEGYVAYMAKQKVVSFSGTSDCPNVDVLRGLNLIGVPCPPAGFSAFNLIQDLGARFEVKDIQRFDPGTGLFQVATYDAMDQPIGDDFPVSNGEGYVVNMLADKAGLQIPAPGSSFPPFISGISPGRGVPGTLVVILGDGFDPDPAQNTVSFNGVGAGAIFATSSSLTVTVPAGAGTGLVRVTVDGQISNGVEFAVESTIITETPGSELEMVSGQTANGTLSAEGEQDRYTFTALAGSLVTISAASVVSGVPDMVLLLEDPYGVVVATDDNGGSGTDARINNFELPRTGTYTIVVSNVPLSGTGSYALTLTITSRASVPQVSILTGNYQTGMNGSTLPTPLAVLVTGATGAPVSGADATFVATEPSFGGMEIGPQNAGSTLISTNASGIVSVDTTLPDSSGTYTVTVTVPGVPGAATFTIAAVNTPVATVQVNGDQQMGTVAQQLTDPLEVVLQDALGQPVGDALVAFQVLSGGGSLSGNACQGQADAVCQVTLQMVGAAETDFTLGEKIDEAQIVAAFVPGMGEPILFEAIPEADDPSRVESNKTNFSRVTLGTSALNAIFIRVYDQFDNPVEDAQVDYNASGGLLVDPGLGPNGVVFPDFLTDETGLHVARVTALYQQSDPTIDEFGASIAGVYSIDATVMGGPSENYVVDVDMGPSQVTWSGQNVSSPYGKPLPTPVQKRILRWQRRDTFIDADMNGMDDDDNGDFRDEDFSILDQTGVPNVTVNFDSFREDRRDETAFGFTALTLGATTGTTNASGIAEVMVTEMGDIGGVKQVQGKIDQIYVEWKFEDGSIIDQMDFTDENDFAEVTNLIAVPVVITIDLDDMDAGIDLRTVKALLNMTPFFDGMAPPAVLPGFPEPMRIIAGGMELTGVDAALADNSAFTTIQLIYEPAADKLMGSNTVRVEAISDKAENAQPMFMEHPFSDP